MKKFYIPFSTSLLLFFSISVYAQNQDEMKQMMAYMTPGDIHKMMAKSEGTWLGEIQMWMQPGADPMRMKGEEKNEMIMGGRYLRSTYSGTMMGMPFEGMSTTGYDNARKIFVTTWIDNMGTGILYLEGPWNEKDKSITFAGKMVDPTTGKEAPVKQVLHFIDANTQIMEMFAIREGKEYKSMEIKYTRK